VKDFHAFSVSLLDECSRVSFILASLELVLSVAASEEFRLMITRESFNSIRFPKPLVKSFLDNRSSG
jgi:hypothetical protein